MITKIVIDCESIGQTLAHLNKIRMDIHAKRKKLKLSYDDEFPKNLSFDDDNCYGEHTVRIKPYKVKSK